MVQRNFEHMQELKEGITFNNANDIYYRQLLEEVYDDVIVGEDCNSSMPVAVCKSTYERTHQLSSREETERVKLDESPARLNGKLDAIEFSNRVCSDKLKQKEEAALKQKEALYEEDNVEAAESNSREAADANDKKTSEPNSRQAAERSYRDDVEECQQYGVTQNTGIANKVELKEVSVILQRHDNLLELKWQTSPVSLKQNKYRGKLKQKKNLGKLAESKNQFPLNQKENHSQKVQQTEKSVNLTQKENCLNTKQQSYPHTQKMNENGRQLKRKRTSTVMTVGKKVSRTKKKKSVVEEKEGKISSRSKKRPAAKLTPSALKNSKTVHSFNQPKCAFCEESFMLSSDLVGHMKIAHKDEQHKCRDCGSCFKHLVHLRDHIDFVHLKLRPFLCTVCPKTYHRYKALLRHTKNAHKKLGAPPFQCKGCSLKFKSENEVIKHFREIHSYR